MSRPTNYLLIIFKYKEKKGNNNKLCKYYHINKNTNMRLKKDKYLN